MNSEPCRARGESVPAGSRFCPSCGETVVDELEPTIVPTRTAAADQQDFAAPRPSSSSGPSDGGRFLPGQMPAERYRIVGLPGDIGEFTGHAWTQNWEEFATGTLQGGYRRKGAIPQMCSLDVELNGIVNIVSGEANFIGNTMTFDVPPLK